MVRRVTNIESTSISHRPSNVSRELTAREVTITEQVNGNSNAICNQLSQRDINRRTDKFFRLEIPRAFQEENYDYAVSLIAEAISSRPNILTEEQFKQHVQRAIEHLTQAKDFKIAIQLAIASFQKGLTPETETLIRKGHKQYPVETAEIAIEEIKRGIIFDEILIISLCESTLNMRTKEGNLACGKLTHTALEFDVIDTENKNLVPLLKKAIQTLGRRQKLKEDISVEDTYARATYAYKIGLKVIEQEIYLGREPVISDLIFDLTEIRGHIPNAFKLLREALRKESIYIRPYCIEATLRRAISHYSTPPNKIDEQWCAKLIDVILKAVKKYKLTIKSQRNESLFEKINRQEINANAIDKLIYLILSNAAYKTILIQLLNLSLELARGGLILSKGNLTTIYMELKDIFTLKKDDLAKLERLITIADYNTKLVDPGIVFEIFNRNSLPLDIKL